MLMNEGEGGEVHFMSHKVLGTLVLMFAFGNELLVKCTVKKNGNPNSSTAYIKIVVEKTQTLVT